VEKFVHALKYPSKAFLHNKSDAHTCATRLEPPKSNI